MLNQAFVAVGLWLIIFPTLFLLGKPFVVKWSKGEFGLFEGILSLSFGLAVFAYFLIILNHVVIVSAWFVIAVMAAFVIFSYKHYKSLTSWIKEVIVYGMDTPIYLITMGILGGLGITFLCALLPEVAHDALAYQLHLPKLFVLKGNAQPFVSDFNSYLPILMNHLYLLGVELGNVAVAKIFHWFCSALLVLTLIYVIDTTVKDKIMACALGALFSLTPTIINEASTTYVDIAVTLFQFIGFCTLWFGIEQNKKGYWFLGGCFVGFALSTKLLAMIILPAYAVFFVADAFIRREGIKQFCSMILLFGLGVGLASGFWFIRNFLLTGNPVYPYFGSLFGGQGYGFAEQFQSMGPKKGILDFILLPLSLVVRPDQYDRGHWIGPLYLVLFPFFCTALVVNKKVLSRGLFIGAFVVVWYLMFHNARFLLQILPLYVWVASYGLFFILDQNRPLVRPILSTLACFLFLGLFVLSAYHYRFQWKALASNWSEDKYLKKIERSYPLAQWINQNIPEDAKILNVAEIRQFYIQRWTEREDWHALRTKYGRSQAKNAMVEHLRKEGFTHVLARQEKSSSGRVRRLNEMLKADESVRLLEIIRSANIRENKVTYLVYQL